MSGASVAISAALEQAAEKRSLNEERRVMNEESGREWM
jgi:hypothetical protein